VPVAGVMPAACHRAIISEQALRAGVTPVASEAWEARTRPVGRTNAILAARAACALGLALGSVQPIETETAVRPCIPFVANTFSAPAAAPTTAACCPWITVRLTITAVVFISTLVASLASECRQASALSILAAVAVVVTCYAKIARRSTIIPIVAR